MGSKTKPLEEEPKPKFKEKKKDKRRFSKNVESFLKKTGGTNINISELEDLEDKFLEED